MNRSPALPQQKTLSPRLGGDKAIKPCKDCNHMMMRDLFGVYVCLNCVNNRIKFNLLLEQPVCPICRSEDCLQRMDYPDVPIASSEESPAYTAMEKPHFVNFGTGELFFYDIQNGDEINVKQVREWLGCRKWSVCLAQLHDGRVVQWI